MQPGHGRRGLQAWVIGNPVAASLITFVLIVGGLLSLSAMKREVFPSISPNTVSVSVAYPGATPFEVEEGITRRVEEAVLGIDGVERVRSVASSNTGTVTAELADFADREKLKDAVQSAVDQLAAFPPERAERPVVSAPDPIGGVITLVISGQGAATDLREVAADIERALVTSPGVSLANMAGARTYEIAIEVSETSLREHELTFADVANAVRNASIDLSGGEIRTESGNVLLRVNKKRQRGADFEDIVVSTADDGTTLTLADVAEIRDSFSDDQVTNTYNGKPAIFLQVSRASGEDVLDVRAAVDRFFESYSPPAGYQVSEFRDQSKILDERFNLLSRNAVFGFGLVFLFLVIMLDIKLAFWICIGMATAFTGGFLLLGASGVTLTMILLFGLIIVLGLVVDDAVVIGENIDDQRRRGLDRVAASIEGVARIRAPVLAGVVTTIIAFSPLLFVGGTFGEITRAIPLVIICVLTVSLFEAFFLLPAHLAHGANWSKGIVKQIQDRVGEAIARFCAGPMKRAVTACVGWRFATLTATVMFFIFTTGLVSNGSVKFVFFPRIEGNEISADIDMPDGSPFSQTEAATRRLENAIYKVAGRAKAETGETILQSVAVTIGGRSGSGGGPLPTPRFITSESTGQVQVELTPFGQRQLSAAAIERMWREETGEIRNAESVNFRSIIADFGSDIQFELSHFDDATLESAADRLKAELAAMSGVYEISDSLKEGKTQYLFELSEAGKAAGLRTRDIATQLRQGFFGEEVQRIQRGREEIRVYVRFPAIERRQLSSLDNFRVRLPDGTSLPLGTVATYSESRAPASINRVDGRRVITVNARVDDTVMAPGVANETLIQDILPALEAAHPGLQWAQSGAARDQSEDFASLARAFVLVLLIIYTVLASQFRSYIQPLAIMVAVPLGIAGALLGHYVLGFNLSFVSMFGIVALVGVSINASVVLVDNYNRQRAAGMTPLEAAVHSSLRRFRPVLLTTLTTALGLLPLLFETSPQAQFLIPMAVSLGFGILISGTLVLFSTPALCVLLDFRDTVLATPETEHPAPPGELSEAASPPAD